MDDNISLNSAGYKDIEVRYIFKVLAEAKKLGLKAVKITGGEPFLRKEIFEVLEWLKNSKLRATVETNGTLIGEREAKALKGNKVSFMSVSLDGPDASTHEKLRGVKGSFIKAVEGIKNIRKYNPGLRMQIICSLWKHNKNNMKEMIEFCVKLGVFNLKINPIMNVSRADSMKKKGELLTIKQILGTWNIMKKYLAKRKLENKFKLFFDVPPAFKSIEELKNSAFCFCGIKSLLGILGDGTISICGIGSVVKELAMGNIKDTSIKDVWENNKILKLIRNHMPSRLEGVCGKCMMKHFCLGKCRAEAYWENKSLLSPNTFCSTAYKEGIFPKNRLVKN